MRRAARFLGALLVGGLVLSVALDAGAVADSARNLLGGDDNRTKKTTKLVNQGKGPALKLRSRGRSPALAVSNTRLVKRLNADLLDGRDAADLSPVTTRFVVAGRGETIERNRLLEIRLPTGSYVMTGTGALRSDDGTSWQCLVGDAALVRDGDERGIHAIAFGTDVDGPHLSDVITVSGQPLAIGCLVDTDHRALTPLTFTFRAVPEVVSGQGVPVPFQVNENLRLPR